MELVAELWRFMRVRKKFWLLPILIMMVVFGGLVVLTKGSVIAPFIYTGFGIMKPGLFAGRAVEAFPLSPFFSAAADHDRLYGQRLDGVWFHVGTPDALADAEQELQQANT